jgi:REP element-mobilizing transposase RayT
MRTSQLPLDLPVKNRHGGRRTGAGRKPAAGATAGHPHGVRPFLSPRHPVHVVLSVTHDVGLLRRRRAHQAFRRAAIAVAPRADFRLVHISLQRGHVHLLCEADDRLALANGVRAHCISAARHLNDAVTREQRLRRPRRGRVFTDRYHATAIKSPTQARNALAYVLNNWRKHREDAWLGSGRAVVDPYSSAVAFPGWFGRDQRPFRWPAGYEPIPVAYPHTWLLVDGWRRAGPDLPLDGVPGR